MPQTTAILKAETKGFVEANQQAAKINKAASVAAKEQLKNTKDVEKELGRMGDQLKDLARQQVSLNKEMEKVDRASEAYKKLAGTMNELNKQQNEIQRAANNVERAFVRQNRAITAAQMARGGFAQGVLQGITPGVGPFLQRGPGMQRQMAGMAIGRAGRGMAGAVTGMPFGGLGALAQGLMSIPGGAALGVPLMQATRQAAMALQFRGGVQQAMPFLGIEQLQARTGARLVRARRGFTNEEIERRARRAAEEVMPGGAPGAFVRAEPTEEELAREGSRASMLYKAEKKRLLDERAKRIGRATAERREFFESIAGPGARLAGIAKPEAFQFAAQVAQVSGGRAIEMVRRSPEFFRTAFAAKTLYGAGPEVAGAFMQAERRGGLVGAAGRGGEAFAEALGQATAIGLEGSEINDFLSIIASGIQDWKRTGIQINAGAITGIARGVGAAVGAVRGMAIARGMQAAATGMAARGPQTSLDLMMMQAAGYRGGGAAEFERAQIALEEGLSPQQWNTILERLIQQGGGGAGGRLYAATRFREAGIQMPGSEMQKLAREGIREMPGAPRLTGMELEERAAAAMDPALARRAGIMNEQISAGNKLLKATQDLEATASTITKAFSEELGPLISDVTGKFLALSKALPGVVEAVKAKPGGFAVEYGKRFIDPFGVFFTGEGE
jgi:hypothetical protein